MSEEEVQELEEWADEAEEAWAEVEDEPAEKPNLYVALRTLSTRGGLVAPGMVTELDPATAEVLIKKGKVRPVGEDA